MHSLRPAALGESSSCAHHALDQPAGLLQVRKEFNRLNAVKKPKPPPQQNGTNETNASAPSSDAPAPEPVRWAVADCCCGLA